MIAGAAFRESRQFRDLQRYADAYFARAARKLVEPVKVKNNAADYAPELEKLSPTWGRRRWEKLAAKIEGAAGNPVPALPFDASDDDLRIAARGAAAGMYSRALSGGKTLAGVRESCEAECAEWGIEPPDADLDDRGALARMFESDWWVRRLRVAHGRRIEGAAIGQGYVHKRAGCYVSDVNVERRRDQRARNARALENTELENQDGEVMNLAEIAARSNANPAIRRAELMTRIAGFEAVAGGLGHAAEFWTLTAPSRFHAIHHGGGKNAKHDGSTPRDAQAHLVACWAKCRAAMQRRGIRVYGFRIAEPHHDGCPHWHVLLWMDPYMVQAARGLVWRYFLDQHDPDEYGARENRCKFVAIDPERGSAAGYVAKYVAKNIDGFSLGKDLYGNDEVTTAERVDAWAATWRIRQFQQIGGAPVGVWRELRRIPEGEKMGPTADKARAAADAGEWADYLQVMGGPLVKRADLPLKVAKTAPGEKFDPVDNFPKSAENRYGEPAAPSVFGVEDQWGARWLSRRYRWESRGVSRVRGESVGRAVAVEPKSARVAGSGRSGVGCGEGKARSAAPSPSGLSKREARAAWTRVNNCTDGKRNGNAESADVGGACRGSGGAGHAERHGGTQKSDGGQRIWRGGGGARRTEQSGA